MPDNFSGRQGKRGNREASRAFPWSWPILLSSPSWFKCVGPIVDRTPGPPPFQLTPFDPPSEISQRKPCYTPPIPAASHFQPRVRCGHSSSLHRSFPEHAPNESRTRPPEKHLKFIPKKMGGPKSTHTIYFTLPIYCHPPPKAL